MPILLAQNAALATAIPMISRNHYVAQQYLPDDMAGVQYYEYGDNKTEQAARKYWENIKAQR